VPMMGSMDAKKTLSTLLLVGAMALGACAEEAAGPTENPRGAVMQAMTSAYGAGTMHEEFRMEVSAAGESFTFTGEGDVDTDRRLASMSLDMGPLGGTMEMVMAGRVVYMRSPMFGDVGTEWVKIDPSKLDPAAAARLGGGFGGTTDPAAFCALLAGAVDVERVGNQEIGGVQTTHYEGTIDIQEVFRRFPEALGEDVDPAARRQLERQLEVALEGFEELGIEAKIPFEVWVDEQGRPRRQLISMDFSELVPGDEEASMEIQVDYSAFGEPVDIEPPAEGDTTDITKLMSEMEGAATAAA
jgi:hypothetical protein